MRWGAGSDIGGWGVRQLAKEGAGEGMEGSSKSFSKGSFRNRLANLTETNPADTQAHHIFPQKFEERISELSGGYIDVNDAKYGSWWKTTDHLRNAWKYNKEFEEFLRKSPNRDQILNFGREQAKKYGRTIHF